MGASRRRLNRRKVVLFILIILAAFWGIHHFTATSPRLKSAWNKIIFTSNNNVAIAVYSPKTHRTYSSSNVPNHKFHMVSTVKVSILAGLLVKQDGVLSSHQRSLAKQMIEASDNNSTSELFDDLGGQQGLQSTFNQFGMKYSTADSSWGLSTTMAKDQIKLLNNIFYKSNLLSTDSQQYISSLMSNVESDQISASSDNFALKNGWLENGNEKWIINSIGYVKNSNGTSYTIAMYSDKNQSMQTGEEVLNQLARVTKPILN